MTTAEILAMQPGPELDDAITKALGGCAQQYRLGPGSMRILTISDFRGASTTWEGIRLVVEAMRKRGWEWEVSGGATGETGCGFSRDDDSICKYAEGKDAPHAVAIAALLALEGEQQ